MIEPPPARLAAQLPEGAEETLTRLVELVAADPAAPISDRDRPRVWKAHVGDSLAGAELPELAGARRIADLGSGAGFPGLVLAIALPRAEIDLIESIAHKCAFLSRAIARTGIANARAVKARSEEWAAGEGLEAYDAVTARAVGSLATVVELATPLLRDGGHLVAWEGKRNPEREAAAERACPRLALAPAGVRPAGPLAGGAHRHFHLFRKTGPTPTGIPRRPGMAAKKPLA